MFYEWTNSGRQTEITGDGRPIAVVGRAMVRERAEVEILGRPWEFGSSGPDRTATTTDQPGLIFTAHRPSAMRRRWQIRCGRTEYEIAPAGFASNSFDVLQDGTTIGESGRARFWSVRPTLTVPDFVPTAEAVFLLWIAFLMRKRAATAASAGS